MRPKVYIETSVISYLTSKPSRDIVTAGRQEVTREWWATRESEVDLYVSEFVLAEALAIASIRRMIDRFCLLRGYEPCVICMPEELLEG